MIIINQLEPVPVKEDKVAKDNCKNCKCDK